VRIVKRILVSIENCSLKMTCLWEENESGTESLLSSDIESGGMSSSSLKEGKFVVGVCRIQAIVVKCISLASYMGSGPYRKFTLKSLMILPHFKDIIRSLLVIFTHTYPYFGSN